MRTTPAVLLLAVAVSSASAAPAPASFDEPVCVGDCDGNSSVTIAELVLQVGIALGEQPSSRCESRVPPVIDVLVTAVLNALRGCPQPVVQDLSGFTRFDFARGPSFGFCPVEGSVLTATILHEADGTYLLKSSVVEPGTRGSDACIAGEAYGPCYVARLEPCRSLTAEEVARLRSGFRAVTVSPGPTEYCGYADRCIIHDVAWDDVRLDENDCADRRLTDAELRRIGDVVDSLGAGPARECPAELCRSTGFYSDLFCNDGNATGGDGCAANCTDETARPCVVDEGRSHLVLEPPGGFPIGPLVPTGSLLLLTGSARSDASLPAELRNVIPLVAPVNRARFDPIKMPGTACLCLRAIEDRTLGLGNAAGGRIQCGDAERGSAQIDVRLSATALQDTGACDTSGRGPGDSCRFADYGPDCLPCTDDDARTGIPMSLELTTDEAGGSPFDCDALAANPEAGLGEGSLVAGWTDPALGDVVLTLACK